MAEGRAAHITSETSVGGGQPSIFDVLAEESLMSGLKPALGHLIKYLSTNFPGKVSHLNNYFDEAYALFDLTLQNYFLKRYGASFAENFYGMKRVLTSGNAMDLRARIRSLIFLVLIPYIKLKLDKLYERLKDICEINSASQNRPSLRSRLIRAFVTVYPYLNTSIELWSLVLQIAYLLSKSSVHSPWLWLAGVKLSNLTPEDLAAFGSSDAPQWPKNGLVPKLLFVLRAVPRLMLSGVSRLLGVSLFFLQFLDWWYSSEQSKNVNALPVPPAPQTLQSENQIIKMDPRLCPICHNRRKNDTVLSVSGYVFCYLCISRYLQQHKSCPVTKLPANSSNLIRIFSQATI